MLLSFLPGTMQLVPPHPVRQQIRPGSHGWSRPQVTAQIPGGDGPGAGQAGSVSMREITWFNTDMYAGISLYMCMLHGRDIIMHECVIVFFFQMG